MLKHLTLSSGWMQKQQWMLHLYWLEVIRRYFVSFLSLPHPQTVQSWESAPVFRLRSARAHRAGRSVGNLPLLFYLLSDIQISGETSATLIFKTMRGEIVQIHLREREKKEQSESSEAGPKKDASRRSEETGDGAPAAGVTLGQRLFPPHRDAHPPPPNHWSYYSSYYHYDYDFTTTISPHPLPDKAVCALWLSLNPYNRCRENKNRHTNGYK